MSDDDAEHIRMLESKLLAEMDTTAKLRAALQRLLRESDKCVEDEEWYAAAKVLEEVPE